MFDFGTWKQRDYPCVLTGAKVGETQEALEETMMNLNTMNVPWTWSLVAAGVWCLLWCLMLADADKAQRHSIPFKEELNGLLSTLSDTGDTIERWFKAHVHFL